MGHIEVGGVLRPKLRAKLDDITRSARTLADDGFDLLCDDPYLWWAIDRKGREDFTCRDLFTLVNTVARTAAARRGEEWTLTTYDERHQ